MLPPMRRNTRRAAARQGLVVACCALSCTGNQPGASAPERAASAAQSSAAQSAAAPAAPEGCTPALFCDDFEDDTLGKPPGSPWRDETGPSGASVSIDGTRAFSGQKSVHVSAPKGAAYRRGYFAIHQSPVFPAASQEFYGRAMFWLEQAPITPAGQSPVHWTFIQGEGRSANDKFNSLYRYGGQHQGGRGLMANFETTPPTRSDCWQHSASTLPVQEWTCMEWHFKVASNEMQLWLNGEELTDLHVAERASGPESGCLSTQDLGGQWLAPPAFQSLYLGWERYQVSENDQDLWIDDVAISKSRVGCPTPQHGQP
jgi:polysaccharide lyase-like protein